MNRPTESDFEVKVSDAGVGAIFNPTRSHYSYYRLADAADVARLGPISRDPRIRHAGPTGDTDDYPSDEVESMAYRLAAKAMSGK